MTIDKKSEVKKYEWIGIAAVVLGAMAFVPLLWNFVYYRSTHSLHFAWLAFQIVISFLWLWYGIEKNIFPNILNSIIFIIAFVFLFTMKYYWESRGLAMHQTSSQ